MDNKYDFGRILSEELERKNIAKEDMIKYIYGSFPN